MSYSLPTTDIDVVISELSTWRRSVCAGLQVALQQQEVFPHRILGQAHKQEKEEAATGDIAQG